MVPDKQTKTQEEKEYRYYQWQINNCKIIKKMDKTLNCNQNVNSNGGRYSDSQGT